MPKRSKHNLFLLHLNDQNIYYVPMIPQIYVIFSGLFITHRQHSGDFDVNNNEILLSVTSYGNQQLFNYLHSTLIRKGVNNHKILKQVYYLLRNTRSLYHVSFELNINLFRLGLSEKITCQQMWNVTIIPEFIRV